MNKSLLSAFAITALIAGTPIGQQAQAGTGIQRCQAADGTTIYSDKACAAVGGQAVPMSAGLLTRIAREQARAEAMASAISGSAYADAEMPLATTPAAIGRRSVSGGCARTPTQLAMDLRGAFALQDVNRIAESYHWVGMSSQDANRIMQRLETLADRPLTDTQYFDAQISSGVASMSSGGGASSIGGSGGVMQLTFAGDGGALSVTDFDVQRQSGCYFVRF